MTTLPPHARAKAPMPEPFDPYRKWLGIPPKDQPPHHYRLLGIATFEDDPDVIENAAARQMTHVRTFQTSKQHGPISQRILTELSAAKVCLLDPERKAGYDEELRARLAAEGKLSSADLTQAVAAAAEETEPACEPEFPPLRRGPELRWRTGAAPERKSPPVPIPMPIPTGTAVAAPAFPSLRPGTTSRAATMARTARRKKSTLPIVITVVSLLVLIGLGVAAIVINNQMARPAANKSSAKSPTTSKTSAAAKGSSAAEQPKKQSPTSAKAANATAEEPPSAFPIGTGDEGSGSKPAASEKPKPSAATDLGDLVRQAIFFSERALLERNDDEFRQKIATAEQLVANENLPQQEQFKQRVDDLRVLKQLHDEFWASVHDNLKSKVLPKEPIEFRGHKFELLARDGETIEYLLDGEKQSSKIEELPRKAALLIAYKTVNLSEPASLLPAAAFLAIDPQAAEEDKKLAKQFFALARQAGTTSGPIGRQIGLGNLEEPITLDEDFAGQVPAPVPVPEKEL